jgi:prepilin peptidase dependent protein B
MLKKCGFTLIEIMISLSLSGVAVLATTSLLASTTTSLYKLDQVSRLQAELNTLASVLYEDIRNMGYDALALQRLTDTSLASSPFSSRAEVAAFTGEASLSCILFTHDINQDGQLNTHSPNERRGYRLRNGALEVRIGGRGCREAGWQDLNASDFIHITQLHFDVHRNRSIVISLSAKLAQDDTIQRTITIEVPIKNAHI